MAEISGHRSRTVAFDPASESVRRARVVIRDLCTEAGVPDDALDTVLLLTSELVTNAVVHGEGQAVLAAELDPGLVRVAITDASSAIPQVQHNEGLLTEGGRGMLLVEELASGWGVEPDAGGGKRVWFEVTHA